MNKKEDRFDWNLYHICKSAYIRLGFQSDKFWFPHTLDSETSNHSMRVCMYAILMKGYFNFPENWARSFVDASLKHDFGKDGVESIGRIDKNTIGGRRDKYLFLNKKDNFTEEDRRRVNDHIDLALLFLQEEPMRTIIAYHHAWQKNPVLPMSIKSCKRTKETDYLSKLLAIADCYDAAATRINTRNSDSPKQLTPPEVKEILMEEYGNLKINYRGNKLPRIKTKGRDLIERLYNKKIIGEKNLLRNCISY